MILLHFSAVSLMLHTFFMLIVISEEPCLCDEFVICLQCWCFITMSVTLINPANQSLGEKLHLICRCSKYIRWVHMITCFDSTRPPGFLHYARYSMHY